MMAYVVVQSNLLESLAPSHTLAPRPASSEARIEPAVPAVLALFVVTLNLMNGVQHGNRIAKISLRRSFLAALTCTEG